MSCPWAPLFIDDLELTSRPDTPDHEIMMMFRSTDLYEREESGEDDESIFPTIDRKLLILTEGHTDANAIRAAFSVV
jgi:hypothetical protein